MYKRLSKKGNKMPQQQCPWCGHCGPRYQESEKHPPDAHSDGSKCVCKHITCYSRQEARRIGGRYYDKILRRFICMGGCERVKEI